MGFSTAHAPGLPWYGKDHDIEPRDQDLGLTPLQMAAKRGHDDVMGALIHNFADINATFRQQSKVYCTRTHPDDYCALNTFGGLDPNLDLELLEDSFRHVDRGYEDIKRGCSWPALAIAAEAGNNNMVDFLLQNGADIERVTDSGGTALMHAAAAGQTDTVELLLDAGANMNAKDNEENSVLHHAVRSVETLQLLLRRKADVRSRNRYNVTALDQAFMARNSWDVLQVFVSELTGFKERCEEEVILVYIAGNGWAKMVEELLQKGASTDARDGDGNTALTAAAREGHEKTVKLLLDHGADIEAMDDDGNTALVLAMARQTYGMTRLRYNDPIPTERRVAAAKLLIAQGAKVWGRDWEWDVFDSDGFEDYEDDEDCDNSEDSEGGIVKARQ